MPYRHSLFCIRLNETSCYIVIIAVYPANVTTMSAPRLVLVPNAHAWSSVTPEALKTILQEIGLAGEELTPGYLAAGRSFLDYLSFLGCAPTVVFEPPSDKAIGTGQFYHLKIQTSLAQAIFRSDSLTYKPKCPHCKNPLDDWRQWWGTGLCDARQCPGCGKMISPQEINWRRRAGCGKVFIEILGIHAETVKPVRKLFDDLEAYTGTEWRYFFVEDSGTYKSPAVAGP